MVGFFFSQIWKKAPFVRLLIPVIAGIVIQDIFTFSKWLHAAVIFCSVIPVIFSLIISPFFAFQYNPLSGFLLHLVLAALGGLLGGINAGQPLMYRVPAAERQRIAVEVISPPERKGKSVRCLVSLRWNIRNGHFYVAAERVQVYFRDTIVAAGWEAGTVRVLETKLLPIRNSTAKEKAHTARAGFDYVGWCARRHIYTQVFVRGGEGMMLTPPHGFGLQRRLTGMQEVLRGICRRYVPARAQGGLLEALLFGYTRDLDPDVMRDYSDAGVVHIIAISGLHLALIAELLMMMLTLTGSGKTMQWIRLIVLLTVIWGYSLLTGASPSVLRSAVMFSFVALARHFAVQAPVCNALAASAFLLLCDDPSRLWDTGFQLSYAAVLSLVLFNGPVRQWLRPRNKLLVSLWQAASVSLAAQILTTPVSIWYFHRFPFYFLLTNMVAVPLSSAILLGGIALILLSGIPVLAAPLGNLLDLALQLMNAFVRCTNRLPGSAVTSITIHPLQVLLCYTMLYCGCRFAEKAEKTWLFYFLIQFCVFLADGLIS